MAKKKIFISSVQREFSAERKALHEYITADPLLGKFFESFLFEMLPATDQRADHVYLYEVDQCDIYLGILGAEYGFENEKGFSTRQFAYEADIAHSSVVRLESGLTNPTYTTLLKLAEALEVDPGIFFD